MLAETPREETFGRRVGRARPDGYEEAEGTHLENRV